MRRHGTASMYSGGGCRCGECSAAKAAYDHAWRISRHPDAGPRPQLRPCGTLAAYRRHHKHGEESCEPCRAAAAAHRASYRAAGRRAA